MKLLIFQMVLAVLGYAGYVMGIVGTKSVVEFVTWVVILPSAMLIACSDKAHKCMAREPRRPVLVEAFGIVSRWAVLVLFVWTGHFWTGLAWAVTMVLDHYAQLQVDTYRGAQHATE